MNNNNNMQIAQVYLELIYARDNSEKLITEYITFMGSLSVSESKKILRDEKTVKLLAKINAITDRQAELNRSRREIQVVIS